MGASCLPCTPTAQALYVRVHVQSFYCTYLHLRRHEHQLLAVHLRQQHARRHGAPALPREHEALHLPPGALPHVLELLLLELPLFPLEAPPGGLLQLGPAQVALVARAAGKVEGEEAPLPVVGTALCGNEFE